MDQPICPTCGLNAIGPTEPHQVGGLLVGNYICPLDHLWITKWSPP